MTKVENRVRHLIERIWSDHMTHDARVHFAEMTFARCTKAELGRARSEYSVTDNHALAEAIINAIELESEQARAAS